MWPGSLYAANFMSPRAKEREQYHYESSFQIEQAPSGSLHHLGDLDRAELWAHVKRLSRSMPKEVGDLQNHFCCPVTACGKQLARRDVVNNLSKADQDKVDTHLYTVFVKSSNPFSDVADQLASKCESKPLSKKRKGLPVTKEAKVALGLAHLIHDLQEACEAETGEVEPKQHQTRRAGRMKQQQGTDYNHYLQRNNYVNGYCNGKISGCHPKFYNGPLSAVKAQAEDYAAIKIALDRILGCLKHQAGYLASDPIGSSSIVVCAVVLGSPLALLLHKLMQNDSVAEIKSHISLYAAVIQLLNLFKRSIDLLPIFLKPAILSSKDKANNDLQALAPRILDVLRSLNIQCKVIRDSAKNTWMYPYSDHNQVEAVSNLSLAMDLDTIYESVQKAASTMCLGFEASEIAIRYCKEMSDLKVHRWPALTDDHAFIVASSFGRYVQGLHKSTLDEISTLRINQELDSLAMGLPVAWASSIFVVADEARVNVMRAMIIGPEGTLYENGIYLFDILLPPDYPKTAPNVQFIHTTAGQQLHSVHPKLHAGSQVVLSLLNLPGSGSSGWDPAQSTMLQVLVGLQGLFSEDPHQPLYTADGHIRYLESVEPGSRTIRLQNLIHALLPALTKPPPAFKDLLRKHFTFKRTAILAQMAEWAKVDDIYNSSGCYGVPQLCAHFKPWCERIIEALEHYQEQP